MLINSSNDNLHLQDQGWLPGDTELRARVYFVFYTLHWFCHLMLYEFLQDQYSFKDSDLQHISHMVLRGNAYFILFLRSNTGWFPPLCPNFNLNVFAPQASSLSADAPYKFPKIGTFPKDL